MKSREEILKSKGYWTAEIQMELFREIDDFMTRNNMNRTQLAEHLGCTKGYVTQLLSGDFDNKMSKFVELCLAIGKVPEVVFKNVDNVIMNDGVKYNVTLNIDPSLKQSDMTFFKSDTNKKDFTAA